MTNPDCICDRKVPLCASCAVAIAHMMRVDHPDSLSVSMLKRRLGRSITGREAALLVEATRRMAIPRNGRNGRYVERSPTGRG